MCFLLGGDQPFKKSQLSLTINDKQGDWDCDRFRVEDVWVCPKCGTLKINI